MVLEIPVCSGIFNERHGKIQKKTTNNHKIRFRAVKFPEKEIEKNNDITQKETEKNNGINEKEKVNEKALRKSTESKLKRTEEIKQMERRGAE